MHCAVADSILFTSQNILLNCVFASDALCGNAEWLKFNTSLLFIVYCLVAARFHAIRNEDRSVDTEFIRWFGRIWHRSRCTTRNMAATAVRLTAVWITERTLAGIDKSKCKQIVAILFSALSLHMYTESHLTATQLRAHGKKRNGSRKIAIVCTKL